MREEHLARLSRFYTDRNDHYYLHYRSLHALLLRAAQFAHGTLLDIGCGNKPYSEIFTEVTKYIGCDVVQSNEHLVDVISVGIELPFPTEVFDTVFSTQVLEHVAEFQQLLNESFRVLRPNGHIILSAPMYWHLHEEPHDFFRYTQYGLKYILEKAGFQVVQIMPNGGKWALLGQVFLHTIQGTIVHRNLTIRIVNRVFAWLDEKYPNEINTINYVAVAVKQRQSEQRNEP